MHCNVCNGIGVLQGGPNRPTVVCGNCHGSGIDKNTCQVCGGALVDDNVSRLCLCSLNKKEDKVNHPKHYTFGTIEVIDVIEDWQLGFCEGNCIKYIARAKHKGNELEDLKKAQWYLNRKISDMELEIAAKDDK